MTAQPALAMIFFSFAETASIMAPKMPKTGQMFLEK